jgi:hypothetical protein
MEIWVLDARRTQLNLTVLSQAVLLVCSALVVGDGAVTWLGARRGLRELNPFLRHVMKRSGSVGLMITRAAAVGLLFLLFEMLDAGLWLIFGSTLSIVLSIVLLNDLIRLRRPRQPL